jgi:hypothetical protein
MEATSMTAGDSDFIEVNSPEEVPTFANEDEEDEFWQTHSLGPGMLARMKPVWEYPELAAMLPPPRAASITVRLEGDIVQRLLALASKKGTKHRTLVKEFVIERLYEEEKREGLVGAGKRRRKSV